MEIILRNAIPSEFEEVGRLLVNVYSQLDGFPTASEQPEYYQLLANIGQQTNKPKTELLVAVTSDGTIKGGVLYFGDMKYYGSGGTATAEKNAAGFRLLAVDPLARGLGIGKRLVEMCVDKARLQGVEKVVIHSTTAMKVAWRMYEKMSFVRARDLDFMQSELPAFGFRLYL